MNFLLSWWASKTLILILLKMIWRYFNILVLGGKGVMMMVNSTWLNILLHTAISEQFLIKIHQFWFIYWYVQELFNLFMFLSVNDLSAMLSKRHIISLIIEFVHSDWWPFIFHVSFLWNGTLFCINLKYISMFSSF